MIVQGYLDTVWEIEKVLIQQFQILFSDMTTLLFMYLTMLRILICTIVIEHSPYFCII